VEPGESPQSLDGLSILVVDDEMDARTVVAETLRLEGARVTVTDSAGSAFKHLQGGAHFDILVTDIGMPEEDGYSLVRKLRRLQTGRHMLAVAVTGYASKGDVAAAIEAGFDLHVPKPVDFDTFVPMIRRLAALTAGSTSTIGRPTSP
jgi:CheY-like chemotaxis protein